MCHLLPCVLLMEDRSTAPSALTCPCNATWHGHSPVAFNGTTSWEAIHRCAEPPRPRPAGLSPALLVEVVVAHCSMELSWLRVELERLEGLGRIWVGRVSVYSKCSTPVVNASAAWTVYQLPNVGRNDHTYAHHIATSHGCMLPTVFFVKDRPAAGWSSMKNRIVPVDDMVRLVATSGFACGFRAADRSLASFHWAPTVSTFSISSYKTTSHNQKAAARANPSGMPCTDWSQHRLGDDADWVARRGHAHDGEPSRALAINNCKKWHRRQALGFKAPAGTLRSWLNNTGAPAKSVQKILGLPLWQMCYGGSFAARRPEIVRWPHALWRWLATSLVRGDNIAEGHYMERLWGVLLAPALRPETLEALLCATGHVRTVGGYYGMLHGCSCRSTCSKYLQMVKNNKEATITNREANGPHRAKPGRVVWLDEEPLFAYRSL